MEFTMEIRKLMYIWLKVPVKTIATINYSDNYAKTVFLRFQYCQFEIKHLIIVLRGLNIRTVQQKLWHIKEICFLLLTQISVETTSFETQLNLSVATNLCRLRDNFYLPSSNIRPHSELEGSLNFTALRLSFTFFQLLFEFFRNDDRGESQNREAVVNELRFKRI